MSDLLSRIAAAQRDAGESVVMEDLKAKGIRLTLCPDCGEPSISAAEGVQQCTSCGYSEEDEPMGDR
jgi:ribosomal protein L37AE/L43A